MTDLERLKLSAALSIASCHRLLTPSSQKASCPPELRITWRQWWEKRFNDDYARFVREHFEYFKPKTEPTHDDTRKAQAQTQNQSAGSSNAQGGEACDTRQGQQEKES